MKRQKTAAEMALLLIANRIKSSNRIFEEHRRMRRWSQLPGTDGMITGLIIASNILREEIELSKKNEAVKKGKK